MTRAERIAVAVACKALASGADPGMVAQYLEQVLLTEDEAPRVEEMLRPGGAP